MARPSSEFKTVFCATCYAGPGEMCSDPRSTRWKRVGYHMARRRELWAKQRLAAIRAKTIHEEPPV